MSARTYIEAIAAELARLRGRGLLLSSADACLALRWHAAQVPLDEVLGEIRRAERLRARKASGGRGAVAEVSISLQTIAPGVESRLQRAEQRRAVRPVPDGADGTAGELRRAARAPGLAARAAWASLAERSDALLAAGGDAYWSEAFSALRASLREMPRASVLGLGAALRETRAMRPAGMPRDRYRRSLQQRLLSLASDRLGVPPRAFLL